MSQGHMSSAVHKVTAAALREYADRRSSPPGTDSKASQVSRTMPPAPFESPKNRRLQVPICSTHNFLADRRRAAWTGAKCCALQEMGRELGSLLDGLQSVTDASSASPDTGSGVHQLRANERVAFDRSPHELLTTSWEEDAVERLERITGEMADQTQKKEDVLARLRRMQGHMGAQKECATFRPPSGFMCLSTENGQAFIDGRAQLLRESDRAAHQAAAQNGRASAWVHDP